MCGLVSNSCMILSRGCRMHLALVRVFRPSDIHRRGSSIGLAMSAHGAHAGPFGPPCHVCLSGTLGAGILRSVRVYRGDQRRRRQLRPLYQAATDSAAHHRPCHLLRAPKRYLACEPMWIGSKTSCPSALAESCLLVSPHLKISEISLSLSLLLSFYI